MRAIEYTIRFKRDYRRELKGRYKRTLEADLSGVLESLLKDETLAVKFRDHALSGNWADHRDCHLRPDLVLIYRLAGLDILQLVRLGSHSELGL
ncbi:type II toxin-antitoxin system YafQ family toxin [Methylobacterium marchantiae]|uniref:Type II toxin-antitoxin system YafQ family toxin n=1 Tax=Methylobacterium marchantiae TaxID=600331 RepID=A0ABW3X334_9HYPH|nr:mRNA interferase toxin YafQ [Methylobacterium marchantiae]